MKNDYERAGPPNGLMLVSGILHLFAEGAPGVGRKGLSLWQHSIDRTKGELLSDWYLALNPNGGCRPCSTTASR